MAEWYYAEDDEQRGPVSRERLMQLIAAGQIDPADLVWTDSMDDWAPAGQVPGLIPAGTAVPPREARRAEYEQAPAASRGMWESLSPGTKVGMLIGVGGGVLAVLLVLALVLLAPAEKPPAAAGGSTKTTPGATTTATPGATPATPTQPVLTVLAFDPKSIKTAEQKRFYEEGVVQGKHFAELEAKKLTKDATKEQIAQSVKGWLDQRDRAIYMAVDRNGADSREALLTFGRRDGMKTWLKEHKMPMPEEK